MKRVCVVWLMLITLQGCNASSTYSLEAESVPVNEVEVIQVHPCDKGE